MNNSENDKKFKVTDRRRFDSEGTEKGSSENEAKIKPDDNSQIKGEGFVAQDSTDDSASVDMAFISLVHSLGAQALMQLGEIPPPDGVPVQKDIPAAKQSIDWLEMIARKTANNLDSQETYFLEELLHNLHISFLKNK
jgi:hypothetical protein